MPKVEENELLRSRTALYRIVSILGEGSFGKVVKCLKDNKVNQPCAVKVLKHNHLDLQKEYGILAEAKRKRINHVIDVYECFNDKGLQCISMELASMSLLDYLETHYLSPWIIGDIAQQMIMGIKSIHEELGIIHGDVKPANLSVSLYGVHCKIKYIDFGCSINRTTADAVKGACIQSGYYRSPEVILGYGVSEAIDLWSIGCVLAELEFKKPLFPGTSNLEMLHYFQLALNAEYPTHMIRNGVHRWNYFTPQLHLKALKCTLTSVPILEGLADPVIPESDYFVDIVKALLVINPEERIKPSDCLAHPYFSYFTLR